MICYISKTMSGLVATNETILINRLSEININVWDDDMIILVSF